MVPTPYASPPQDQHGQEVLFKARAQSRLHAVCMLRAGIGQMRACLCLCSTGSSAGLYASLFEHGLASTCLAACPQRYAFTNHCTQVKPHTKLGKVITAYCTVRGLARGFLSTSPIFMRTSEGGPGEGC